MTTPLHVLGGPLVKALLEEQMEWIKCSERQPEDDVDVLAFSPNGIVITAASILNGTWYTRDGQEWDDEWTSSVTHWMPLPAPPEVQP